MKLANARTRAGPPSGSSVSPMRAFRSPVLPGSPYLRTGGVSDMTAITTAMNTAVLDGAPVAV